MFLWIPLREARSTQVKKKNSRNLRLFEQEELTEGIVFFAFKIKQNKFFQRVL